MPTPFQRNKPLPELEAMRRMGALQQQLLFATHQNRVRAPALRGQLGDLLRQQGRLVEAIVTLKLAVREAHETLQEQVWQANRLRLATALFYNNEHDEAESIMRPLLLRIRNGHDRCYEDFVLQHLGKCVAEVGRWEEAVALFEEALELRKAKGVESLIRSTEKALSAAREKAGANEAAQD